MNEKKIEVLSKTTTTDQDAGRYYTITIYTLRVDWMMTNQWGDASRRYDEEDFDTIEELEAAIQKQPDLLRAFIREIAAELNEDPALIHVSNITGEFFAVARIRRVYIEQ